MWQIAISELHSLQIEFKLIIPAFVLMDNHFHLLMLTPQEPIDRVMFFFMKNVTRKIQKRTGRINKIFGGRYKGCLINDSGYFFNAYKYVLRNPVAAHMTSYAEEYRYSTLFYFSRGLRLPLEIEEPPLPTAHTQDDILKWINGGFEGFLADRIRFGLSRSVFQLKKKI